MKKIDSFSRKDAKSKYNWEKILDGSIWEIEQGKDFTCSVATFQGYVHKAAKDRGLVVKTRRPSGGSVLQVQAIGR